MTIRICWRMDGDQLAPVSYHTPDPLQIPAARRADQADPVRIPITVPKVSIQSSSNAVPLPIQRRPKVEASAPVDLAKEIAVDRIRQIHRSMVRRGECE